MDKPRRNNASFSQIECGPNRVVVFHEKHLLNLKKLWLDSRSMPPVKSQIGAPALKQKARRRLAKISERLNVPAVARDELRVRKLLALENAIHTQFAPQGRSPSGRPLFREEFLLDAVAPFFVSFLPEQVPAFVRSRGHKSNYEPYTATYLKLLKKDVAKKAALRFLVSDMFLEIADITDLDPSLKKKAGLREADIQSIRKAVDQAYKKFRAARDLQFKLKKIFGSKNLK